MIIKMSGAAGLSAAKRRRGGVGGVPAPGQQQRPQQPPRGAMQPPRGAMQPPPGMAQISPMKILETHETRLNNLDNHLQDIVESFGAQMQQQDQSSGVPHEDMGFFRDKISQLENKIEQLEGLLSKVQTFAMETSTMVMKSNNGVIDDDVLSECNNMGDDGSGDDGSGDDMDETHDGDQIELQVTG
jgi:hypothetical protein